MVKRVFLAINLPQDIKKILSEFKSKFSEIPAKWVEPKNLHLTLVFLGYLKESYLQNVIEITKNVSSSYSPFSLKISKVSFAPPKMKIPRMIWAYLEKSKELFELEKDLKTKLIENKIPFLKEEREFFPHITLARIRKWEFLRQDPEEKIEINEELDLSFDVNSIEVMESKLKRPSPEYFVLASFKLSE